VVRRRLLDTDTLSYILKQREPVASKARAYISDDGDIAISAITYYEIMRGSKFAGATQQLQAFEYFTIAHYARISGLEFENWAA